MHKEGDEIHLDDTEASGGSKEGVVRWILLIGTLLAIIALTIIWTTGALTQGGDEEDISVSNEIASEEAGDDTDSIVSENADEIEGTATEGADDDGAVQTIDNET